MVFRTAVLRILLILVVISLSMEVFAQPQPVEIRVRNFKPFTGVEYDPTRYELKYSVWPYADTVICHSKNERVYYSGASKDGPSTFTWERWQFRYDVIETYITRSNDTQFYFDERTRYDSSEVSGDTLKRYTISHKRVSVLPDVSDIRLLSLSKIYDEISTGRDLGWLHYDFSSFDGSSRIKYSEQFKRELDSLNRIVIEDMYEWDTLWKWSKRLKYLYEGDSLIETIVWDVVGVDSLIPTYRYDQYVWWHEKPTDPLKRKYLSLRSSYWNHLGNKWGLGDSTYITRDSLGRVIKSRDNRGSHIYDYFEDGSARLFESRYIGNDRRLVVRTDLTEREYNSDGSISREAHWWRGPKSNEMQDDSQYYVVQTREYTYPNSSVKMNEFGSTSQLVYFTGSGFFEVDASMVGPFNVEWYDLNGRLLVSSIESSHCWGTPTTLPERHPLFLRVWSKGQMIGHLEIVR